MWSKLRDTSLAVFLAVNIFLAGGLLNPIDKPSDKEISQSYVNIPQNADPDTASYKNCFLEISQAFNLPKPDTRIVIKNVSSNGINSDTYTFLIESVSEEIEVICVQRVMSHGIISNIKNIQIRRTSIENETK